MKNVFTIPGSGFESDDGKVIIVKKVLYGLKISGPAVRAILDKTVYGPGHRSIKADPDIWIHHALQPCGNKYY